MCPRKLSVLVLVCFVIALSASNIFAFDDAMKDKIISLAFDNFWGKARLSDGSYVQPENEKDRQTLPISKETAYQVIDVGEISGLAKWCSLDWQKNYSTLTRSARNQGFSEKQVAFVGLLHGVTQGLLERGMKGKNCDSSQKEKIVQRLEESIKNSLQGIR